MKIEKTKFAIKLEIKSTNSLKLETPQLLKIFELTYIFALELDIVHSNNRA